MSEVLNAEEKKINREFEKQLRAHLDYVLPDTVPKDGHILLKKFQVETLVDRGIVYIEYDLVRGN